MKMFCMGTKGEEERERKTVERREERREEALSRALMFVFCLANMTVVTNPPCMKGVTQMHGILH